MIEKLLTDSKKKKKSTHYSNTNIFIAIHTKSKIYAQQFFSLLI